MSLEIFVKKYGKIGFLQSRDCLPLAKQSLSYLQPIIMTTGLPFYVLSRNKSLEAALLEVSLGLRVRD